MIILLFLFLFLLLSNKNFPLGRTFIRILSSDEQIESFRHLFAWISTDVLLGLENKKKGLRMQSNHRCFLFYLSIGIFLLLSLIIRHRMNEHFIVRSFCFWSNRSFFSLIICLEENGTFLCCLLCSIRHIRLWSRLLLILFVRNVQ